MLKDIEKGKSRVPSEYGGKRIGYLMSDVSPYIMLPKDAKLERELFKEMLDRWKAIMAMA